MKTVQIVKILLVIAIMVTLFKLVAGRSPFSRRWGGGGPRPYAFDRYEGYSGGEDDNEEDDYESDEDGEDDEDGKDDEDNGEEEDYEEEDYEEDDYEDEDDEDDQIEGFSNAAPSSSRSPGTPMMNVATDLLPKSSSQQRSKFGEFAPKSLLGQNFLDAKKYIGVDTKGSSLRNANYDLRSSPAIPRQDVGPWSNSTIDGDLYRKPLE